MEAGESKDKNCGNNKGTTTFLEGKRRTLQLEQGDWQRDRPLLLEQVGRSVATGPRVPSARDHSRLAIPGRQQGRTETVTF